MFRIEGRDICAISIEEGRWKIAGTGCRMMGAMAFASYFYHKRILVKTGINRTYFPIAGIMLPKEVVLKYLLTERQTEI